MARKIPYNKSHLSIIDQIARLKSRGMQFADVNVAAHYLSHMNYYRLTAYWLPYERDHTTHRFYANTYFEEVLKHYVFDRELRLLVLYAIERIEVSVKAQMAHTLSSLYGSHPHMKPELFHCPVSYAQNLSKLKNEFDRSSETFSDHFKTKYIEKLPPIWAAVELMTMGHISYWYSNIKKRADRNAISRVYGLDESILKSFLHHLTIIRNICAHHGRLWNRRFTFAIKLPNYPNDLSQSLNRNKADKKSLYNTLVFLKYLMDKINPSHQWDIRLKELLESNCINVSAMGFPTDWKSLPVWQ